MIDKRPIVPLDSITTGVVEAVAAWNDHLAGDGTWTTSAIAAHLVFTTDLFAPWSPLRAADPGEMKALETLGSVVDLWRENTWFFTSRRLSVALSQAGPSVRYLDHSLGVQIRADIANGPRLMRERPPMPFSDVKRYLDLIGIEQVKSKGGIPAGIGQEPPVGYPVKGNQDSLKYHDLDSPWYARTVAEIWFADSSSAEYAGFSRAGS